MPNYLKYIENLETESITLSGDSISIPVFPDQGKFKPTVFDHLYDKYINNDRKRPVLWILSRMAGMEI